MLVMAIPGTALSRGTHANPIAMIAQTPTLTLQMILMFQRNTIGRTERIMSVAAAMAMYDSRQRSCAPVEGKGTLILP